MACVHGLEARTRCQRWCERDCRSVVAGASSKRLWFTRTMEEAFVLYHTFFFKKESNPVLPRFPSSDICSPLRFHQDLFAQEEECTVAFIFQPNWLCTLCRTLACLEHNEFSLVAAVAAPLSVEIKAKLLEQEIQDGFLTQEESHVLDGPVMQLVLRRCAGIHKLAELLAHACPETNAKQCRFSLRRGTRLQPHIRATSSCAFATVASPNVIAAAQKAEKLRATDQMLAGENCVRATKKGAETLIALAGALFDAISKAHGVDLVGLAAYCVAPHDEAIGSKGEGSCTVEAYINGTVRVTKADIDAQTLEITARQVKAELKD